MLLALPVRAGNLSLPPEAVQALDKIYSEDPAAAIPIARAIQQSQPDHPPERYEFGHTGPAEN